MSDKKAVVLFSGGLDSTTCLALAKSQGYSVHALSFEYGQRHTVEIAAAKRVAKVMGVAAHLILPLPLGAIGGSALTADIPVPKDREFAVMDTAIPATYVPARNTIFLSMALGFAEVLGSGDIFIGVNALDYSGYPDCRPAFIEAFAAMANLAVKEAVEGQVTIRIHTPLIEMTKAEIIKLGTRLGVNYGLTHSCYDPTAEGQSCGRCDSCLLRKKGFAEAGLPDPTLYVTEY